MIYFSDTEEKKKPCNKCGKEIEDPNFNKNLPLAERIYCNDCVEEKWKEKKR